MEEWVVKINDVELSVVGEYIRGQQTYIGSDPYYDDPGWGSYIDMASVYVIDSQINIIDILSEKIIDDIEDSIISSIESC